MANKPLLVVKPLIWQSSVPVTVWLDEIKANYRVMPDQMVEIWQLPDRWVIEENRYILNNRGQEVADYEAKDQTISVIGF